MTDEPRDPSRPNQRAPTDEVDWANAPTLDPASVPGFGSTHDEGTAGALASAETLALDPTSAPAIALAPTLDPASAPGTGSTHGVGTAGALESAETLAAATGTGPAPNREVLAPGPAPGERLDGRYIVIDELGHGGMGRVLRVRDERLRREVALKCLLSEDGGAGSNRDSSASTRLRRFQREVQLSGQLEHPSIVPVHDLGGDEAHPYYTMRYVRGRSLAEALREDPTPAGRLRLLPHFLDVCNAMAFAHDRRIIHRDLKPANVILGSYGETMVIDWGLAKVQGEKDDSDRRLAEELRQIQTADDSQTVFGAALGTPAYMAPEQALGRLDEIDHQSDLYSLGAMLYELLTGFPPFSGGHPHRVMLRVVEEPLTPVRTRAPDAPPELAAIAEKALQKDKRLRYASCAELAADVTAWLSGGKVSTYAYSNWELVRRFVRRNRLAVSAALIVLLALVGTAAFMTRAWRQESAARARAQTARGRELDARLQERRAREEEMRQKELAQVSLARKIEEERQASYHLAEAHLARAEHLFRERFYLEAGLHAAAAAWHHPGNPRSPRSHRGFCAGRDACESLTARALGIFLLARQSTHLVFERHVALEPELNTDLYTRNRLHPSPDGRHWLVVSSDRTLRVLEAATGKVSHRLTGHGEAICQATFDATGRLVISVDQNGEWIYRSFPEGKELARVPSDLDTVFLLERLPGTGDLLAGLMDGRAARLDPATRAVTELWPGQSLSLQDLVVSPAGRHLAVVDRRGGVRIYDLTAKTWTSLDRPGAEANASYGAFLASGESFVYPDAMSNRLLAYRAPAWRVGWERIMADAAGGEFYHSLTTCAAGVCGAADRLLAEQSSHLELVSGTGLEVLQRFGYKAPMGSVRTSDRQALVLGSKSGLLMLGSPPAGRRAVARFGDGVIGLIYPIDVRTILVGTWTGGIFLWDQVTGTSRPVGERRGGYVWAADLSPDGATIAVGSWDHTVLLLDYPSGTSKPGRALKFESPVTFVRWSKDGARLFVATFKMLHVLETAGWTTLDRHIIGTVSGNGPPVSASRTHIAFHETDEEISLLELATLRLSAVTPTVKNLADGATRMVEPGVLVVQDEAFCLHLIHPPEKKPRHSFCGLGSFLATASLDPTGTWLLAAGDDHTVRLWSVADERPLLVLPTIVGQVAAFDHEGKNILFERGHELWSLPLDAALWDLPADDLMRAAQAQSGLCLEGSHLKPLHECGANR